MRLFKVSKMYLNSIQKIDKFIPKNDNLVGTIHRLNGYIYFLPVNRDDKTDYDADGCVKHSLPFMIRMTDETGMKCYGKCLISNMFAVPYKDLIPLTSNEFNAAYEKRIEYLKKNKTRIVNSINRIYKQKNRGYNQDYLLKTVNFKATEKFAIRYELDNYGKHYNRFPDDKYFITNPYTTGETEYVLMNKNKEIAKILYNNETNKVIKILDEINTDYAPLDCFKEKKLNAEYMTAWFRGRGIPSWRDGLDDMLDNLGVKNKDILLNKAFGLSLTDQYWMNPVEMKMDWKEINFFTNDFNSRDFIEASFENKVLKKDDVDLFTPNNTSDGMLKKAWFVGEDKKRYLLKGSFKEKDLEPFCEVLASKIAKVLELNSVDYEVEILKEKVISKCKCFIDENTELISAFSILRYEDIDLRTENYIMLYQKYIELLKNSGIENVEAKIAKMYILDYLIVNNDRHLGNFGIIRNCNTLEWIDIAPVFDSGQAMYSQDEIYEYNFSLAYGTFFNNKHLEFDKILEIVGLKEELELDFNSLYSIACEWKRELYEYQHITDMLDEKIETLYLGFIERISKLETIFSNRK